LSTAKYLRRQTINITLIRQNSRFLLFVDAEIYQKPLGESKKELPWLEQRQDELHFSIFINHVHWREKLVLETLFRRYDMQERSCQKLQSWKQQDQMNYIPLQRKWQLHMNSSRKQQSWADFQWLILLQAIHSYHQNSLNLMIVGGVATPADAALMMQLGMDGVFVGSVR
jgi:pyridoxal biosynthesis lyase PdxS